MSHFIFNKYIDSPRRICDALPLSLFVERGKDRAFGLRGE